MECQTCVTNSAALHMCEELNGW